MQAYEGYLENGRFYPIGQPMHIAGRRRVVVTVVDEPKNPVKTDEVKDEELRDRAEWLKRLRAAIDLSMGEDLPDIVRQKTVLEHHGLVD